MSTLLTFTGFQDPFAKGPHAETEQVGPILSLLGARSFDKVILFSTPNTIQQTRDTESEILRRHPMTSVQVFDLPLIDPTDYAEIISSIRTAFRSISASGLHNEMFVSLASGTPQMHAVWLLLIASREIPARILHVRPSKFVSKDKPLVSEIDVTTTTFPIVQWRVFEPAPEYGTPPQLATVVAELGIIGDHPTLTNALKIAEALAASDASILLIGETGTGKELFARLIHRLSGRKAECFVPINCAAIPLELAESVLFGHKKGAFTGASKDQLGKFDVADGGTLFLDELVELPLQTQAKLLRVLEDGLVEPVGAKEAHPVNVRVVAASNTDLSSAIKEGRFRKDLYYRLNIGEIRLPPLRDRASDIPKLALSVIDRFNATIRSPKSITSAALAKLQGHNWPGNIRDLENVLQRAALLSRKDVLDAEDFKLVQPLDDESDAVLIPEFYDGFSMEQYIKTVRHKLINHALESAGGNRSKAARILGMTPQALHKYLGKGKQS